MKVIEVQVDHPPWTFSVVYHVLQVINDDRSQISFPTAGRAVTKERVQRQSSCHPVFELPDVEKHRPVPLDLFHCRS
jgi:hypothetical protein